MAAGLTLYSQISARVNDLIENSMAVARSSDVLGPTVTNLSSAGMMSRKVNEYNAVTWVQAGEEDDTSAQQFTKDALSTLTPSSYRARIDITDQRAESDFDAEMANAALELGAGASKLVNTNIATNFDDVTGGTIGAGTAAIDWAHITAAYALLNNQNVPASSPVYCALHPYQWEKLLSAATVAGSSIAQSPMFTDRVTSAPNFFTVPQFQGITFVISNDITIDGSTIAYGCMYVPQAFAVDTRKSFNVRPQRDESRELTELNASLWFAHGTWRPGFAVALKTLAATPSAG